MSSAASTIRVYVRWTEPTVFAGEEVACDITFKNIAAVPGTPNSTAHTKNNAGSGTNDRHRKPVNAAQIAEARGRSQHPSFSLPVPQGRGHRSTLSLNVPASARPLKAEQQSQTDPSAGKASKGHGHSHRRSVSIISLGASDTGGAEVNVVTNGSESPRVPFRQHGRSASLQVVPRRGQLAGSGPQSAPVNYRSSTHPSPLFQNHSSTDIPLARSVDHSPIIRESKSDTQVLPILSSQTVHNNRRKPRQSPSPQQGFRFPNTAFRFPATPPSSSSQLAASDANGMTLANGSSHSSSTLTSHLSPRSQREVNATKELPALPTRVLSPISNGETPRSSGEFYSVSNHSSETLASEYIAPRLGLLGNRSSHARRASNLSTISQYRPHSEVLMMGYAQIQGSFTLDGSLVDQEPFEVVKRKGAVGGQGGGVIGIEKNKRESGLLRSFGWGNITESLGGLLGGGELSSMKEMRGIANSRTVPLLSTPQSILFVDLKLAPGESRTYQYRFRLPRGLPPTHRGKAIKISYNLVLGTQRPGGTREQQIKSVDIPFRVLGSVNEHGEVLGHDLMSPYIILRDEASVKAITSQVATQPKPDKNGHMQKKASTLNEFLTYTDELLSKPTDSTAPLLTPGDNPLQRRHSSIQEPSTAREAIDMAIMRSNLATNMQQSANRFEIARGGQRVAVVMLARPAYRLGETINLAIEFAEVEIACYAVHISLESTEKVDQSLALRSDASISRVTRKVHASHSESTLFSRRIVFSPAIPVHATPTFITSGVSLEWKLVIEFVTPRMDRTGAGRGEVEAELLEEMSQDDRGVVMAAAEALNCESFEIAVPLRVYGALAGSPEKDDAADGLRV